MSTAGNIPYLYDEPLAYLDITTSEVIISIEALIFGSAQSTVWSAREGKHEQRII
jgi:hypothetical protein